MLDPERTNASDTDYLTSPEQFSQFGHSPMMVNLCKDIMARLEVEYSNWFWAVRPSPDETVITIFSMRLSGEYGYTIHTKDIENDPNLLEAMRAGGEVLTRFRCPLRHHKPGDTLTLMKDIRGHFMPDLTDKDGKDQKKDRDRRFSEAVNDGKVEIAHKDTVSNGEVTRHLAIQVHPEEESEDA